MNRADALAAIAAATEKRGRFPVAPKSDRTIDGIVFASKGEARRYSILNLMERAGEITGLELQPTYKVAINGRHVLAYTADFRYTNKIGEIIVEDAKSSGTRKDEAYRLRKRAVEAFYLIKITEV